MGLTPPPFWTMLKKTAHLEDEGTPYQNVPVSSKLLLGLCLPLTSFSVETRHNLSFETRIRYLHIWPLPLWYSNIFPCNWWMICFKNANLLKSDFDEGGRQCQQKKSCKYVFEKHVFLFLFYIYIYIYRYTYTYIYIYIYIFVWKPFPWTLQQGRNWNSSKFNDNSQNWLFDYSPL